MLRPLGMKIIFAVCLIGSRVDADGTGHHGSHGEGHHGGAHSGGHGDHSATAGSSHGAHHVPSHPVASSHNSSYRVEPYTPTIVTTYLPSSGHGCGARSYDPSTVKLNIDELDYQMQSVLSSLPQAIREGSAAIESNTLATNRDVLVVGLACLVGAVSGSLGILNGVTNNALTAPQGIYLAAMNSWGYGYWGPYLLELDDVDPGCGVNDFKKLVYEYNFITSLDHVYGSDLSSGGYAGDNSDDRPELRKYYVGEFTRKMKLALHCITSQSSSVEEARRVTTLIDKYHNLANRRLDLTSSVMSH